MKQYLSKNNQLVSWKTLWTVWLLLALFFAFRAEAQPWEWARGLDATNQIFFRPSQITLDDEGNVYTVADFDRTVILSDDITLNPNGEINTFLAKYSPSGELQWAKVIQGSIVLAGDLEFSPTDNSIYVMGGHQGTLNVDGVSVSGGNGDTRIYLLKFDTDGLAQWGINSSDTNFFLDNRGSVKVDNEGNVYVSAVNNTGSSGSFGGVSIQNEFNVNQPYYIVKCSPDGDVLWANAYISSSESDTNRISFAVSDDAIYITGFFFFFVQLGNEFIELENSNGTFLATISSSTGNFLDGRLLTEGFIDTGFNNTDRIAVDSEGNFAVIGQYSGAALIYPEEGEPETVTTTNNSDVFIAKFSSNGRILFTRTAGGENFDTGESIAFDDFDNLYITGAYVENFDFGSYSLGDFGDNFDQDIYVGKYSAAGEEVWIRGAGGGNFDIGYNIVTDPNENAYVSGFYTLGAVFDSVTLVTNNFSTNNFLAKISCLPLKPNAILGDSIVCIGTSQYQIDGFNHDHTWTLSGGGTLTSTRDAATIEWTETGTYTITVTPFTACGNGESISIEVTVTDIPQDNPIEGAAETCVGTEIYQVPEEQGTEYEWEISGGGNIVDVNNSALVTWQIPGTYTITVTSSNVCGESSTRNLEVVVEEEVSQPSPISGNTNVCLGTQTYTVSNVTIGSLRWDLSSGGSIINDGGVATVNWTEPGQHTISVVTVGSCGESALRNLTVNVRDVPAQPYIILGSTTTCPGSQENYGITPETNTSYVWTLSGGGVLQAQGSAAVVNWSSVGTHTLTVTPTNECGTGISRTINVTVSSIPQQPTEIVGLTNVCQGEQTYVVPAQTGVNYAWNLSGGGNIIPSGNSATIDWRQPGTYTLTVTPSNPCGSGDSRSVLVTVSATNQQTGNISGPTEACLGAATYSVPSSPGFTYTWSVSGGGTVSSSGNQATINWTSAGLHSVTVASSDGCAKAISVEVRETPSQPTAIIGSVDVCPGTFVYSVDNESGVEYEWLLSSGGTLATSFNIASIAWETPGNHTLTVTPKNDCGNGPSRSIIVNVKQPPVQPAQILGNTLACLSETGTYSISAQADVAYQWSLSSGGTLQTSGNEVTVNWLETGEHQLSVQVVNDCGTSAQRSINITVDELPDRPAIVGEQNICLGVQEYSIETIQDNVEYNWSVSGGADFEVFSDQIVVNWETPGTYVVTATPSNRCGIGETRSLQVNVFENPSLEGTIQGNTEVCLGFVSYTVESREGTTYNWSLSGGGNIVASGNTANISWINSGEFTLSVTPSNVCGVGETRSIDITVSQIPLLSQPISGAAEVCLGRSEYEVELFDTADYTWTLSSGGALAANGNIAEVEWTQPGTHTLSVTPSNACGTGGSRSMLVTVIGEPEQPIFNNAPTDVCLGVSTYTTLNVSGSELNWSLSGGGELTANGNVANINWAEPGTYTVTVEAQNSCGTGESRSVEVLVQPSIERPSINGENLTCLADNVTTYEIVSPQEAISYQWSVSNSNIARIVGGQGTATVTIEVLEEGIYNLDVEAIGNCDGGETTDRLTVEVLDQPIINGNISVDSNQPACINSSVGYSVAAAAGVNYNWSVSGGGTVSPQGNTAEITWTEAGTHTLSVTAQNACGEGETETLTVTVFPFVETPVLLGSSEVCIGGTTERYEVATPLAGVDYRWNLSNGLGSIVEDGNDFIVVDWIEKGNATIRVEAIGNCSNGPTFDQLNVFVSDIPVFTSDIFGQTSDLCVGNQSIYQVNGDGDAVYNWSLSSGGTLEMDGNLVTVNWTQPGTHVLNVSISNGCGAGTSRSRNIVVNGPPTLSGQISGPEQICINSDELFTVPDDSFRHEWELRNANDEVIAFRNEGNTAVTVSLSEVGDYRLSVVPFNECGASEPLTLFISAFGAPETPTISTQNGVLVSSSATNNQWYKDGEPIEGANGQELTPNESGEYAVQVLNPCQNTELSGSVFFSELENVEIGIKVFPNPAIDQFTIELPFNVEWTQARIYDTMGRSVWAYSKQQDEFQVRVDARNFAEGIYYLTIETELGQVVRESVQIR